jgi:hypothetical protein
MLNYRQALTFTYQINIKLTKTEASQTLIFGHPTLSRAIKVLH